MLSAYLGIFLISAATLSFEIVLTRIFSVAQWYHFAFMAVSVALLGFGASGTFLSLFPGFLRRDLDQVLTTISFLFSLGLLISFLTVNYIPFDTYRIAWERKQILYLAVYYLALTLPFFLSGICIGFPLTAVPGKANVIYAFNLAGSGLGCLVVLGALAWLGGASTVILSAMLGAMAIGVFAWPLIGKVLATGSKRHKAGILPSLCCILYLALLGFLTVLLLARPALLDIRMSPYKSLSQALHYPQAKVVFTGWNAFSRVDALESRGIKSAPGLSLAYRGELPPQAGLTTDGDNLSPITSPPPPGFLDHLPTALPYRLVPQAHTLIIQPGGGLDVLTALEGGAHQVTTVEDNPLIVGLVRDRYRDFSGGLYVDPRVQVVVENGRSYVRRSRDRFDIIQISLADTFKPVTSGAYSLSENYLYTVEAFGDYLEHLTDDGLLAVSRWLQLPPSEEVRVATLAVTALEKQKVEEPGQHLAAIRTFSTLLLLVKRSPLEAEEIEAIKSFAQERQFDLVYYPGIDPHEVNRYNVLQQPSYYEAFRDLLSTPAKEQFYARYLYDVSPTTDDRPFFFHFFKWGQTPTIIRMLGKTWQPFGGSGYLVLVALLMLAILASVVLILAPLLVLRRRPPPLHDDYLRADRGAGRRHQGRFFLYFALLGLGFLFVEIPLLQRFILFLDHPIYAFATVLFAVLVFSGLGSLFSKRLPLVKALALLMGAILLYPLLLPILFQFLLGQSLMVRLLATVITLAPLGFLLGIPFPSGLSILEEIAPSLIPWAWGINGCASVVSSILAAMMAVTWGFSWVIMTAAVAYGIGMGTILSIGRDLGAGASPAPTWFI
ncbi:MAG: hypothetical protein ACE5NP_06475 [Anaerolineae bacterium]